MAKWIFVGEGWQTDEKSARPIANYNAFRYKHIKLFGPQSISEKSFPIGIPIHIHPQRVQRPERVFGTLRTGYFYFY